MPFLILLVVVMASPNGFALGSRASKEETQKREREWAEQDRKRKKYQEEMLSQLDRSCQVDSDCTPTPCFGAVNKKWYQLFDRRKELVQCFDGCMGWGQKYLCVENRCVTKDYNGIHKDSICNR